MNNELEIYDTTDVARLLGISQRQARNVCNAVFRAKPKNAHHRLTDRQLQTVGKWHQKFRKKRAF